MSAFTARHARRRLQTDRGIAPAMLLRDPTLRDCRRRNSMSVIVKLGGQANDHG